MTQPDTQPRTLLDHAISYSFAARQARDAAITTTRSVLARMELLSLATPFGANQAAHVAGDLERAVALLRQAIIDQRVADTLRAGHEEDQRRAADD